MSYRTESSDHFVMFETEDEDYMLDKNEKIELNGKEYDINKIVVNPENKETKYYLNYSETKVENPDKDLERHIRSKAKNMLFRSLNDREERDTFGFSKEFKQYIVIEDDLKIGSSVCIKDAYSYKNLNALVISKNNNYTTFIIVNKDGFKSTRKIKVHWDDSQYEFKILN